MNEVFTIFVLDDSINEQEVEHHEVVQWSYKNLEHPSVISVTTQEIYELGNNGTLDIISELNDSMLGEGEDDWVIDNEIKIEILNRLRNHSANNESILTKIIKLFQYSIEVNRNIYFHF